MLHLPGGLSRLPRRLGVVCVSLGVALGPAACGGQAPASTSATATAPVGATAAPPVIPTVMSTVAPTAASTGEPRVATDAPGEEAAVLLPTLTPTAGATATPVDWLATVTVEGDYYILGNPAAPVRLRDYSDFL